MTGGYLPGDQPVDPHADYYTGSPPMQPPGYPTAAYPPSARPSYIAPLPWGYPAPPYQPGYPQPGALARPGQVIAAAVLAYIDAGLLILAGALLLLGASLISGIDSSAGSDNSGVTAELIVDGLLNLVAAGLLIAGGVGVTGRSPTGRVLLTVGAGICVALGVYWLIRSQSISGAVLVLLFTALPVIGVALIWSRDVSDWLRGS